MTQHKAMERWIQITMVRLDGDLQIWLFLIFEETCAYKRKKKSIRNLKRKIKIYKRSESKHYLDFESQRLCVKNSKEKKHKM